MLSAASSDFLGLCVLAALGSWLLGWIVLMLRNSPFSPLQSALYALNYAICRILWRLKIEGCFPCLPDQAAVIVCNHRCPLDPAFIALLVPRVVHWMVAREYYEYPPFYRLLRLCGSIPIARGDSGPAGTKAAIRLLRAGELVGIFPEGRINTEKTLLLPGHLGAALLAIKSRAVVVPCYIHGAPYDGSTLGCLAMPASVRLKIGTPIDFLSFSGHETNRETLRTATSQIMAAIAQLAGDPNFKPQLASRPIAAPKQPFNSDA